MPSVLLFIPWFRPEGLHIVGPITIQPFGLLVAAGIIVGIQIAHRRAHAVGVDPVLLDDFITHTLISGFVLGHVFDTLLYYPQKIAEAPWELLLPWMGMSSFGGFFGAIAGGFLWKWRRGEELLPPLDACAFGMPAAWALGRTGCFIVHDHPGRVTDFVLAVEHYRYGTPPYLPRHDLGLYEVFWSLACVAMFYALQKRPRPAGFFMGMLAVLYAPVRFGLDFLRVDDAVYTLGLTPGHFSAGLSLLLGIGVLRVAYRNTTAPAHEGSAN